MSDNLFPQLSREIDKLGRLCGDIIRQMAGDESFELVEQLRLLVRRMHQQDQTAEVEIRKLLATRRVLRAAGTVHFEEFHT